MSTRARGTALLLAAVVGVGATACSDGEDVSPGSPSSSASTGVGDAGPATASADGRSGSPAPESPPASGSPTAPATSPNTPSGVPTDSSDLDRLLVAADVPGGTQQSPPGRVRGDSRHVATVTLTCAAAPDPAPAYRTDDAFVSVLNTGDGLVTSGLRVFDSEPIAADFMAEWQRRLDVCAGEDFAPEPWSAGDGYGADSFAADSSGAGLGQTLDFYVRDGARVAELHLILTDFSEPALGALVARAAGKFLD